MFANFYVIKKKSHCKINACSLFVSDMEQSVLSSKVQSRSLPRRCIITTVQVWKAEMENASGSQAVTFHGIFRKVNSSVTPKKPSCCRPIINDPTALLFHLRLLLLQGTLIRSGLSDA